MNICLSMFEYAEINQRTRTYLFTHADVHMYGCTYMVVYACTIVRKYVCTRVIIDVNTNVGIN